jgi:hypothetical protein
MTTSQRWYGNFGGGGGGKNGERKVAWVPWNSMTMPKYRDGLGFKDIEIFNLSILARQVWRIVNDQEALTSRILKVLYYPNSDILNADLGSSPSQIWQLLC